MPIDIYWADDAHTIIIIQPIGKWTWDAFYEASTESYQMMDNSSGSHKIHTILDWSKNATFPKDSLMHGRNILNNRRHPRQGTVVLAGMNRVTNALFEGFMQLGGKTLKKFDAMTARTVEEALQKLAELPQTDPLSS
ncbi:MAG: hypothetical protein ABI690_14225 [Chloroflexota bacterium]